MADETNYSNLLNQPSVYDPNPPSSYADKFSKEDMGMEYLLPPISEDLPGSPIRATTQDIGKLALTVSLNIPSLNSVAANFVLECDGKDRYPNNCAHFLSNAFIKAGYKGLLSPSFAKCSAANRPIRAREMWDWFKSQANQTSNNLQKNSGWWAIFQLNENAYWGGHVVLLDSNAWVYYGTGWYGSWNQYMYQW